MSATATPEHHERIANMVFGVEAHDAGGVVPFDRRTVAIMPVLGLTVNY